MWFWHNTSAGHLRPRRCCLSAQPDEAHTHGFSFCVLRRECMCPPGHWWPVHALQRGSHPLSNPSSKLQPEASRREQRMADIIAWLLELHSGSDGDQSQYKDLQSNEMLRELREVYLNEVGLEFQRLRTEPSPDHLSLC